MWSLAFSTSDLAPRSPNLAQPETNDSMHGELFSLLVPVF
jgi:hypothetical protein